MTRTIPTGVTRPRRRPSEPGRGGGSGRRGGRLCPPSIDPRIRQRRVAIQRSQGRKRLLWLASAAGVLVLVVLVVALAPHAAVRRPGRHRHRRPPRHHRAGHRGRRRPRGPPAPDQRRPRCGGRAGSSPCPSSPPARVARHWPDGVHDRRHRAGAGGPDGRAGHVVVAARRRRSDAPQVPGRRAGPASVCIVHTAARGVPPGPGRGLACPGGRVPGWRSAAPCPRPSPPRWCRSPWPPTAPSASPSTRG